MRHVASFIGAGVGACLLVLSLPAPAQVDLNVVINTPPPAVIVEPVPPPRVGYVWAPGFWEWGGSRHVWRPGHWEVERAGELYVQPEWVEAPGGWRFVPAHWARRKHGEDREPFCPPGQAKKGNC